jgi:hypothetical protein
VTEKPHPALQGTCGVQPGRAGPGRVGSGRVRGVRSATAARAQRAGGPDPCPCPDSCRYLVQQSVDGDARGLHQQLPVGPGQRGLLELGAGLPELVRREAAGRARHPSAAAARPPVAPAARRPGAGSGAG